MRRPELLSGRKSSNCGIICYKQCLFISLPHNFDITFTDMDEKLTVARNIKMMREASGYTQENIAAFLGITRSAYSNYELGTRELSLENIEKLADLYGCDGYMFYEENENIIESMLTTAFRVNDLSSEDMKQIAAFKRIVKNSLMMDQMLLK